MTTIVLVGVAGFLVVSAIIVKARSGKRKKPEKWEKAQIVKQLLALSEREGMVKRDSTPTIGFATPDPSPSSGGREHFFIA
jgi:hypothetical protein